MITLGIESSCDETSVAVIKDGRTVLANETATSLHEHKRYGGVVPEIASRSHLEVILPCLEKALKKARLKPEKIDCVAVTQGPGLMGSLLVGLSAAKALAYGLGKPLVGVDHVVAHVYAAMLHEKKLAFPYLGLVISGGHTILLKMESASSHKVLGRTLDDAAGEAFDKVAKILGLGYPGGPEVDRMSRGVDPGQVIFSRPLLSQDSLDFSFSGIKTAVLYHVEKLKRSGRLTASMKKSVCSGFQEAVCDTLVEKSLRAAKKHHLKTIVVGGGVSANSRLRTKFQAAAKRQGFKVIFPPMALCQDNAAMIGALGAALYKEGKRSSMDLNAYPNFGMGHGH